KELSTERSPAHVNVGRFHYSIMLPPPFLPPLQCPSPSPPAPVLPGRGAFHSLSILGSNRTTCKVSTRRLQRVDCSSGRDASRLPLRNPARRSLEQSTMRPFLSPPQEEQLEGSTHDIFH